jgi:hypothetical protein
MCQPYAVTRACRKGTFHIVRLSLLQFPRSLALFLAIIMPSYISPEIPGDNGFDMRNGSIF